MKILQVTLDNGKILWYNRIRERTKGEEIMTENNQSYNPLKGKLDYTIPTSEERTKLVNKLIDEIPSEKLTPIMIKTLTNYILYPTDKEEKKKLKQEKKLLTDNRMTTVNRRETSFQGLAEKLENGEDGIYNMIANDKNIIFTPNISITDADKEEIPALRQLCEEIEKVEAQFKAATGKRKFALKTQLIEMRKDQYVIKNAYRPPMYFSSGIKTFHQINLDDNVTIAEDSSIIDKSMVSLLNPSHISALLCNYSRLKEECYGKFWNDCYFMMQDLEDLIDSTLKEKYPLYFDILVYKIDGEQNLTIQAKLEEKYGIKHSVEYISSLWRNKIPKLLADRAQKEYLIWYYTNQEYGHWKKCSRCGQIKLAHNMFFSKNGTSKDGFYSICKECRNKKRNLK